jgi:hypothetical protein
MNEMGGISVECCAWSKTSLSRVQSEVMYCHDVTSVNQTSVFQATSVKLQLSDVSEH